MRLAYLCNRYPAVSHSFVRREIEAVERAGHQVQRFSVRPPGIDLKDPADMREAKITEVILRRGLLRLIAGALFLLISRPLRSLNAIGTAARLSGPGVLQKARHVAYWLEAAWLVRRLAELRVDHLHAHFGTNPAAVAAIVTAWGGPPFSFTAHGPDEFDAPATLSLGLKIEQASFVAGVSSYGRSQLMRWSRPEHWPKIGVVRCGLDRAFLDAILEPVTTESTKFVCIARLSAQKGLPLLIASCEKLRAAGERFSLTIIGDGEMRPAIEAEIEQRKLAGTIHLAGVQSSEEIREQLKEARAFVLPSFAEGLPIVVMEAMALLRPVIGTSIAGIPELLDNECGWLIPAGSEDSLTQAMAAALHASGKQLTTMGGVGRDRVLRMHDAAANARLLVEQIQASHRAAICTR